jgi:hypothetical protein
VVIINIITIRCTAHDKIIPNDKRIANNSMLRDVSPNMLFNFLPLCILTIRLQVRTWGTR